MALADPLPETHHLLWERIAAVLYAWKEQRGMPSSCGITIATAGKERPPSPLLIAW